jgi:hypothetical protein
VRLNPAARFTRKYYDATSKNLSSHYLSLSHASRARRQMRLFHLDVTARFPAKCTGCNLGFAAKPDSGMLNRLKKSGIRFYPNGLYGNRGLDAMTKMGPPTGLQGRVLTQRANKRASYGSPAANSLDSLAVFWSNTLTILVVS